MRYQNAFFVLAVTVAVAGIFVPRVGVGADAKKGEAIYSQSCAACHGSDGKGALPGVPDFNAKKGVLSSTDTVLAGRITSGYQSKGSAMGMPAKGGNSSLTAQDISDVIAYLRKRFAS